MRIRGGCCIKVDVVVLCGMDFVDVLLKLLLLSAFETSSNARK